ncbi:MAG TPA: bifunctional diguanylate cyclase/phosphodiesterase [Kineosporiaceae bacterium]
MGQPHDAPDVGDMSRLVDGWLTAIRASAGPLTDAASLEPLARRLAELTTAGTAGPREAEQRGSEIADLLVREHLTSPSALRHAVLVLAQSVRDDARAGVPADREEPGPHPIDDVGRHSVAARLTASMAATHVTAVLQVVLEQQESLHSAALAARDEAERARGDVLPRSLGRTREEALEAALRHTATHDALTGLPNRSLFLQRLEAAVDEHHTGTRVTAMFVDLDGFRFVNDSRGHAAGDQVLVAAASRLAEVARAHGALLARMAGDEFAVLLTGRVDRARPSAMAELMLAALERPIDVAGQRPLTVRASIGLAESDRQRSSARELLRAADLALHAAKESGRGQVVTHDLSRTARQLSRSTVATSLPGVVERGELGLAYQQLTRLDTGEPHGVEALLRWNHPRLGELAPRLFVGVAEETSLIVPIGRWVLRQALADLATADWPAVNINVSVRQLLVPTFVDEVRRGLAEAGVAPSRLRLEVTESVIMHLDDGGPLAALRALADDGVRIVMDDFGTGYSNLAALRRLPLRELKLAGTFLDGLLDGGPPDPVDAAILGTVVELAHTLGLTVTAEEVATQAQHEWVRRIGCDIGQGWYYDDLLAP